MGSLAVAGAPGTGEHQQGMPLTISAGRKEVLCVRGELSYVRVKLLKLSSDQTGVAS